MKCTQARLAISARLDGEDRQADQVDAGALPTDAGTAPGATGLDAHLAACPDCQAWQSDAEALTRAVRSASAETPDLAERVLRAVGADRRIRAARARRVTTPARRAARGGWSGGIFRDVLRWALATSAAVQLVLAVPALFAGLGGLEAHVSREMASFDVAIAVGFLLAAARPAYARSLLPVAAVLTACLLATSLVDVVDGTAVWTHELVHLLSAVQAGLLWLVARGGRTSAPVGAARVGA